MLQGNVVDYLVVFPCFYSVYDSIYLNSLDCPFYIDTYSGALEKSSCANRSLRNC